MKKILSKLKYPKLLLLLFIFVITYLIFSLRDFLFLHTFLFNLGYLGTFLAGVFFTYGFTAAPSTAILLILAREQNVLVAGLVAGLGALVGDLIIFKFIRYSFSDEIEKLSKTRVIKYINNKTPILIKKYFIPVLACVVIASPLPDEIGVSLFAFSKSISTKFFSILSYILNTIGIFVILIIGNSL